MSTEGVTLSGAGHTGATANGSTLWRHLDQNQGPKGQQMCAAHRNLSGNRTEKISYHFRWQTDDLGCLPLYLQYLLFPCAESVHGIFLLPV